MVAKDEEKRWNSDEPDDLINLKRKRLRFREFSDSLFKLGTGTVQKKAEQGCSEDIKITNSEQLECVQTILV